MEKKRTSKKQFKLYIKYLHDNKILLTGKLLPSNNPEDLENIWRQLATQLNSCGDGPVREVTAWKKVFTEWKSTTRKKARENKSLSDIEETLIQLTGSGAVTGLDIEELGCDDSIQKSSSQLLQPNENTLDNIEGDTNNVASLMPSPKARQPATPKTKKKGTGNLLCDTYKSAVADSGDKLQAISDSILEVAKAIHRYCDIVESQSSNDEEIILQVDPQERENFDDTT